nr:Coenzyme F420 hydrogenase/dehydrogenase, beta subunit C-terminal domain [Butyrivibrio fibrisolvens]
MDDISFRGENEFYFSATSNNEKVYYEKSYFDLYYESFLRSVSYRDNCYSCRYAKIDRVSDLTIGDYWGLDKSSLHKPYLGRVSEILVNTAKGKALLDKAGDYLHTEQASLKVAIDHNEQLSHPSDFPADRNVFVEAFKGDFIKASYKTAIGKRIKKVIMKKRLKRLLKGFKSSK